LPPDLTLAARFEDDLSQLIKKVIPPTPPAWFTGPLN
jgi:hypothetical protein